MKFLLLILLTSPAFGQWYGELDSMARAGEKKYGFPSGIARAFNLQENSGRTGENADSRVEDGFYNVGGRYNKMIHESTKKFFKENVGLANHIPYDFERFQQSSSWGPWQLMGFNLRALGCKKKYLSELSDEEHLYYFFEYLKLEVKRNKGLFWHAVSAYNGGLWAAWNYKIVKDRRVVTTPKAFGSFRNQRYVNNIKKYQQKFS